MRRSMLVFGVLLALVPQLALADALSDGTAALQKRDYERAVTLLRQAAAANPDDPRPYAQLERAYEALYRLSDALAAHDQWQILTKKAAQAAKPATKPVVDEIPLPPVYVMPGPRHRLPPITNDMIPKSQPTEFKATPLDSPKPVPLAGSDAAAKGAAVTHPAVPAPAATPTPAPNLAPITEDTGLHAPPVTEPPPLPSN